MRTRWILCFALGGLTACSGKDDDPNGGDDTGPGGGGDPDADVDGDGYRAERDCDDNDANVNPGETEICNGKDDNCDGAIDEELIAGFFPDADGDGFGIRPDEEDWEPETGCPQDTPPGYAPNDGDCDDDNPNANPGEQEVCDPDNLDENCNAVADDNDGAVDPKTKTEWWADVDKDGFGDRDGLSEFWCDGDRFGVYIADNNNDCDDTEGAINPAADEICDDEIDNNCSGTVDICPLGSTASVTDGESLLPGGYVSALGDINEDALGDVGVSGADIHIFAAAERGSLDEGDATASLLGLSGVTALATGDFDLDEVPDLILSQSPIDIVSGPLSGDLTADGSTSVTGGGSITGFNDDASMRVSDVNGEGLDDLAALDDNGNLYVLFGPITANQTAAADADIVSTFTAQHIEVPDINGDGMQDLMVGGDGTGVLGFYGPIGAGDLTAGDADVSLADKAGSCAPGVRFSVGDVTGDGAADLIAGCGEASESKVISSFSGDVDITSATATVQSNQAIGAQLEALGDFNRDGVGDLLGRGDDSARLFYGPLTGTIDADLDADASFGGSADVSDIAAFTDINGDGVPDFGISEAGSTGIFWGR